MENPAVIVTVATIRPSADTVTWSDTDEGQFYFSILFEVYNSYGTDNIEVTHTLSEDGLTRVGVIQYKTKEIYEEARQQALWAIPDFYDKRDAYSAQHGIIHTYNIQEF